MQNELIEQFTRYNKKEFYQWLVVSLAHPSNQKFGIRYELLIHTLISINEEKWGKKYPIVFQSWRNKWENLTVYFQYPEDIRRVIYTTNIIESVHRQFRTLTKTKGAFPNDNSLLKLLYAGIQNAEKKWTMPIRNWSLTISQLNIHFKERLQNALNLV